VEAEVAQENNGIGICKSGENCRSKSSFSWRGFVPETQSLQGFRGCPTKITRKGRSRKVLGISLKRRIDKFTN